MKIHTKILLGLLVGACSPVVHARQVVNSIVAIVNGNPLTQSDLEEPQIFFGGKKRSYKQMIEESLLAEKAKDWKITVPERHVEKRMNALKEAQGFGTQGAGFDAWLETVGLSQALVAAQIRLAQVIAEVKHILLPQDILVPRSKIEQYYQSHPSYHPERYKVSVASLEKKHIDADKGTIKSDVYLEWESLDWVNKDNLSNDMAFVANLKLGQMSDPIQEDDSLWVYRLDGKEDRRLASFDERYTYITKKLEAQERQNREKRVISDLVKESSVVCFTTDGKPQKSPLG